MTTLSVLTLLSQRVLPHLLDLPEQLKQLGRFASLNHNIYIEEDPTHVDVDHAAHKDTAVLDLISVLSELQMTSSGIHLYPESTTLITVIEATGVGLQLKL